MTKRTITTSILLVFLLGSARCRGGATKPEARARRIEKYVAMLNERETIHPHRARPMPIELSEQQARRLRMHSQRLDPEAAAATVEDAVSGTCGLQAQDAGAAALGVRARSRGLTAADVDAALHEDRSIVRTWCVRGTFHFVATEDLSWLLSLFGPLYVSRGRRRLAQLGFDDDASERAMDVIRDALADHGSLTRSEVASCVQSAGIDIDASSQAPVHLVRRAALLGILCEVAPKDGDEAYGLVDEWVSPEAPPEREAALAELARRYLAAYQPASLKDFASWSGLYVRDVRTAWERVADETTEVRIAGEAAAMSTRDLPGDGSPATADAVRLLPRYDTYLLGYETRSLSVPAEYEPRVWPGGGQIRATVVRDGKAVGTWKVDRSRATPVLRVEPFEAAGSRLEPRLRAEAADVGRFLGTEIEYEMAAD